MNNSTCAILWSQLTNSNMEGVDDVSVYSIETSNNINSAEIPATFIFFPNDFPDKIFTDIEHLPPIFLKYLWMFSSLSCTTHGSEFVTNAALSILEYVVVVVVGSSSGNIFILTAVVFV